jgi:hypothetical protein
MIEAIFTLQFRTEEMPSDAAAWIESLRPEAKVNRITPKGRLHEIAAEFPNLEKITALAAFLTVQSELDWSCRQSYSVGGHVIPIRPDASFVEQ